MDMKKQTAISCIKKIDFGEVDAYGDPNLEKYFLDYDYWQRIIEDPIFFVIGRKGTGKSAVYRIIKDKGIGLGHIVENKDFGEFPFEKLLSLDDSDFSSPNQYQSIWKSIILNLFATMISTNQSYCDSNNVHYREILEYVDRCIGHSVTDLHKSSMNMIKKTSSGLQLSHTALGKEISVATNIDMGSKNLTAINSRLLSCIEQYLLSCGHRTKLIIQFDRLDDNYNQYQNVERYYHSIISLFKVVYSINQEFRAKKIDNAKIVLYLRSDILSQLSKRDAESARWDDFCLNMNWAIINRDDWKNPKLLQMVNKRIDASFAHEDYIPDFRMIFNNGFMKLKTDSGEDVKDIFKYIVTQTMHRPRDIIKFCKCIQNEVRETNDLYFRTIKKAERKFTDWLVNSELSNEINPITSDTKVIFDLLRLLGRKPFSITDFNTRYKSVGQISLDADSLIYFLYDLGILGNVKENNGHNEFRSVIRNAGSLDRNMKLYIHPGIWTGINA